MAVTAVLEARSSALTINLTYTSNVTSLVQASKYEAAINYAALQFDQMYTNPITLNFTVDRQNLGANGLGSSNSGLIYYTTYSTLRTALTNGATTSDQTTNLANNWPSTSPIPSTGTWVVGGAQGKALNLSFNYGASDGTFTFASNQNFNLDPYNRAADVNSYDLVGVAEHEFSELMGRIFGLGTIDGGGKSDYQPYDLTHYTAPNTRDLTGVAGGDYFSIDAGATNLKKFNTQAGGDATDWNNQDPNTFAYVPDSFNAFSDYGIANTLTPVDATVMDILGYNRSPWSLTFKGGFNDFLSGGNWSSSSSTSLNPFHGASMLINSSSATAYHEFTPGENFVLASNSDMGQSLEVRAGALELNDSGPVTGAGFGLLVNQDGALTVDGSGEFFDQGPLSIGDTAGVTNAVANFSANGYVDIANSLQTEAFFVGNAGNGSVNQTGSAYVSTPELILAYQSTGVGSYTLNTTSTLAVSGVEIIGENGFGIFQMSAGTNSAGSIIVGEFSNAAGSELSQTGGNVTAGSIDVALGLYNFGGGNINTGTLSIDSSGDFEQFNGTLNATTQINTGGQFNQHGGLIIGTILDNGTFTFGAGSIIGGLTVQSSGLANIEGNYAPSSGIANYGKLNILAGDTVTFAQVGPLANESTGTLHLAGTITGAGTKTNLGYLESSGTISGSGTLVNDGVIQQDSGVLSLTNTFIDGYTGTGSFNQITGADTITASDALVIGDASGSNGTYTQSAGSMTANGNEFIGDLGTGTYNLSAGTNSVAAGGLLILGGTATGSGTYNLSGTGLLSVSTTEYIGDFGAGIFQQTGGTNSITNAGGLIVGFVAGSNGQYSFSAGSLTVPGSEIVGDSGQGAFNQTGGTHSISGSLDIGSQTASIGSFTLGGTGTLQVSGTITVGNHGNGTFTQNGGTATAPALTVGANQSSSGSYELDDPGTLTVNGSELIGSSGTGTFNQTGGTNTIHSSDALAVGLAATSHGTYDLSGGSLNSDGHEFIGDLGAGAFDQTGGVNAIASGYFLIVAAVTNSTGTYTLDNVGTLNANGEEYIGDEGNGTFNQIGGIHNVNLGHSINIGFVANSTGDYEISGGVANISGNVYVGGSNSGAGGAGQLNISQSGALNISGSLTVYNQPANVVNFIGGTMAASVLNFNGNPALFQWTSGTLNVTASVAWDPTAAPTSTSAAFGPSLSLGNGQTLEVTGDETIGGAGAFSLSVADGAAHVVTGNMTVAPTGTFTGTGTLTAGSIHNGGSFSQTGTLNAQGDFTNTGAATIGGTQNWSPGTNLINNAGTVVLQSDAGSDTSSPLAVTINAGTVTLGSPQHWAGLSISDPGQLDIANNHVFIAYGAGPDPIASIAQWVAEGYAGGAWTGNGIMSSDAQLNSASYGIGFANSADPGNPADLPAGTIEIRYTLLGDADLNAIVNGIDFGILAANFNKSVASWDAGDFDYNNIVNGIDFGLLAANFNKGASGAAVGPSALSDAALVAFALENGLMGEVPEPACATITSLAAGVLLTCRRRSLGICLT
jgi:hypothetical protein